MSLRGGILPLSGGHVGNSRSARSAGASGGRAPRRGPPARRGRPINPIERFTTRPSGIRCWSTCAGSCPAAAAHSTRPSRRSRVSSAAAAWVPRTCPGACSATSTPLHGPGGRGHLPGGRRAGDGGPRHARLRRGRHPAHAREPHRPRRADAGPLHAGPVRGVLRPAGGRARPGDGTPALPDPAYAFAVGPSLGGAREEGPNDGLGDPRAGAGVVVRGSCRPDQPESPSPARSRHGSPPAAARL
jgi:hypothetical protein